MPGKIPSDAKSAQLKRVMNNDGVKDTRVPLKSAFPPGTMFYSSDLVREIRPVDQAELRNSMTKEG